MVSGKRPSRADYYQVLATSLPADALVVTALGNASYLWAAMHHTPENFYIEDAMGLALPLALGLAVAQPARRVVVVEGDGAVLMHMGVLVTLGAVAPRNLTVLLIQNGVHAASGGQVLTNPALDLAQLARSAGVRHAENIGTPEAFGSALGSAVTADGPRVLVLATEPDLDVVRPPMTFDPVVIKDRFMTAIGAPRYVQTMFGGGRLEPGQ
jgi:thiamine pyrophosphate-dependent acetolactate synthase large subunit-like protein